MIKGPDSLPGAHLPHLLAPTALLPDLNASFVFFRVNSRLIFCFTESLRSPRSLRFKFLHSYCSVVSTVVGTAAAGAPSLFVAAASVTAGCVGDGAEKTLAIIASRSRRTITVSPT